VSGNDEPIPLVPEVETPSKDRRRAPASAPRLAHAPKCPGCGYDVRGLPLGARCPECGAFTGNPLRQRGAILLMHAGRPTVAALLWRLAPIAVLAIFAAVLLLAAAVGCLVDRVALFGFPTGLLPLALVGVLLASKRLTRHEDADGPLDRRQRVCVLVAALLLLVHALVLVQLFIAITKPIAMAAALDVAYTILLVVMIATTICFFAFAAARLRGVERWMTGDVEGSLFTGATGVMIFGPTLIIGFVDAMMNLSSLPLAMVVWRIDGWILGTASVDLAWRTIRALRLAIHTLRLAGESLERETRMEEAREAQLRRLVERRNR